MATPTNEKLDLQNIKAVFEAARRAHLKGNNPFAARLVSADNKLLLESENTQITDKQILAHAEMNLLHRAVKMFKRNVLASATLYTSVEPCAMCAGAIFLAGIGRLVFGLSTGRLHELIKFPAEMILTGSREILQSGGRKVEVIGPLLGEDIEHIFIENSK